MSTHFLFASLLSLIDGRNTMSNNNAADKAREKADQAKDFAEQGKQTLLDKLREDGVYATIRYRENGIGC